MVWFMQMICLHSIANDAEENPGPIIFHIIDPTSTHLLTLVFLSQVLLAAWHFFKNSLQAFEFRANIVLSNGITK